MREVKFMILIYWWELVFVSVFVFVFASDWEYFVFGEVLSVVCTMYHRHKINDFVFVFDFSPT